MNFEVSKRVSESFIIKSYHDYWLWFDRQILSTKDIWLPSVNPDICPILCKIHTSSHQNELIASIIINTIQRTQSWDRPESLIILWAPPPQIEYQEGSSFLGHLNILRFLVFFSEFFEQQNVFFPFLNRQFWRWFPSSLPNFLIDAMVRSQWNFVTRWINTIPS